ncbi:MAG: hypothetical protein OXF01_15385 [Gemmatimonadetes bacterium]|nr:hypothetical protein [Gemmatimonadota bacterium]
MSRLGHAIRIRSVVEDPKSAEIHRAKFHAALAQGAMEPLLLARQGDCWLRVSLGIGFVIVFGIGLWGDHLGPTAKRGLH